MTTMSNSECKENGSIVYLGAELPDKDAASHRIISNAKIFREFGRKVILLGSDRSMAADTDVLQTKFIVQGFESYQISYPNSIKQWIRHLCGIDDIIKVCESVGNVDILVLYNHPAISMIRLKRYCRKHNISIVADVTEWYSARGRGFAYWSLKGLDTCLRMRFVHKHIDGIIVISRYLQDYYKNCKNVVYIPSLTDIAEDKWCRENVKAENGILKLVYAGSPGQKDKISILIDALAQVKRHYHLDVIGITQVQYLGVHANHEGLLSNSSSIVFHGRLSHSDTLEYIKNADFSCFFRDDDRVTRAGFPTKFSEAITCGTPVITNKSSNIADYMKNQVNGYLVEELTSECISECLENVNNNLQTERNTFDYHRYMEDMSVFLEKLEKR